MFILCLICLLTARFYDLRWWLFGHSVLDELPINLFIYWCCQEDWMTSMISWLFLQHHGTVVILRLFFMTTSEWIAMKFCTISRPLGKLFLFLRKAGSGKNHALSYSVLFTREDAFSIFNCFQCTVMSQQQISWHTLRSKTKRCCYKLDRTEKNSPEETESNFKLLK